MQQPYKPTPQRMGPFGFLQHESNPYPDESTLLFWHDLKSDKIESFNADWREQSAWVNENIPEYRRGRERLERPWLAIRDAYETAQQRIKQLEGRLNAGTDSNTGSDSVAVHRQGHHGLEARWQLREHSGVRESLVEAARDAHEGSHSNRAHRLRDAEGSVGDAGPTAARDLRQVHRIEA